MKISVNGDDVFELTDVQKKVIQNDIDSDIFEDDMKRRLQWALQHKYLRCFERLKKEWEPKLKERNFNNIPLDNDEFATLVFKQYDYKDRNQREREVVDFESIL